VKFINKVVIGYTACWILLMVLFTYFGGIAGFLGTSIFGFVTFVFLLFQRKYILNFNKNTQDQYDNLK